MEVTVIGAGVVGLATASALADRGCTLRIYERGGEAGPQSCSWWAGGMLAPHCEGESAEEAVVRLGGEAAAWWDAHTGLVQSQGSLVLTTRRDQSDLTRFARRTTGSREVRGPEIDALEPALEGRFGRGLYFDDEAHLPPRLALARLRERLAGQGAEFIAEEVDPRTCARTGLTVDCRGFAARDALTDLRGVKGEMVVLRCRDLALSRPVRLLHPRMPLYVVPRGEGVFMLGATMVEGVDGGHVTARGLLELLSAAYALHPAFGEAEVLEIGVDTRPAFPDNLPRIRREGALLRVNGLFRHGFLLAPAVARMVAELLLDGQRPEIMDED